MLRGRRRRRSMDAVQPHGGPRWTRATETTTAWIKAMVDGRDQEREKKIQHVEASPQDQGTLLQKIPPEQEWILLRHPARERRGLGTLPRASFLEPGHLKVSRSYKYDRYAGLSRQRAVVGTENVIAIVPRCACPLLTSSSASEGSATHRPSLARPNGVRY